MSYEQNIKEARTIEAMKNGYMGLGGKFGQIAKKLGQPIIKQGGIYSDSSDFDSVFEEEQEEIPTIEEDEATYEIGWHFDGLSKGINISITILHHMGEIKVAYEGRIVYKESSGELEAYSPEGVWEDWIKKLYDLAKRIQKKDTIEQNKIAEVVRERKKLKIIEELKKKWGI